MTTGSIDLAATIYLPSIYGGKVNDPDIAVGMETADISGATAWALEYAFEQEGTWFPALDSSGTAITGTLATIHLLYAEAKLGMLWRVKFAAGSTGTVSYTYL